VDSTTHLVYVTHFGGDTVSVIDGITHGVVDTLTVDRNVQGVAVDPDTNTVYVITEMFTTGRPITGVDQVSVIDGSTRSLVSTLPADSGPRAVAVDPETHSVYVANSTKSTVSVIDAATRTITANVPVDNISQNPGLAVDPSTHTVYVTTHTLHAGNFDDSVAVIDGTTRTITATVPVRKKSSNVAVDPETHIAYVTNPDDGTVSIIESVVG
jgi:YVTN family beta-propeller protein